MNNRYKLHDKVRVWRDGSFIAGIVLGSGLFDEDKPLDAHTYYVEINGHAMWYLHRDLIEDISMDEYIGEMMRL